MGGTLEKMKGRSDRRVGITNRLDDPAGADRDRSDLSDLSDLSDEGLEMGGGRSAGGMDGNERRRRRRSRRRRRHRTRQRGGQRHGRGGDANFEPRNYYDMYDSNEEYRHYRHMSGGDYYDDVDEVDDFAREVGRINSRRPDRDLDRHMRSNQGEGWGHHERHSGAPAGADAAAIAAEGQKLAHEFGNGGPADMEEFARRVLTPRPLSVEPSVNVDVDDAYFTRAERREYEQPIPVTPTSPPGWGEDIGESIRWRRGELLGSGAYGNVYLGLNLDTGELMGAKQIGLRHTGFVVGGREYTDHISALQTEIALMKGLNHVNIGASRFGWKYPFLFRVLSFVVGGIEICCRKPRCFNLSWLGRTFSNAN